MYKTDRCKSPVNEKMNKEAKEQIEYLIKMGLAILIMTTCFLVIWNQYVDWKHKVQFLGTPCDLCADLNPHLLECFDNVGFMLKDSQGNIIARGEEAKEILRNKREVFVYPVINTSVFNSLSDSPQ